MYTGFSRELTFQAKVVEGSAVVFIVAEIHALPDGRDAKEGLVEVVGDSALLVGYDTVNLGAGSCTPKGHEQHEKQHCVPQTRSR